MKSGIVLMSTIAAATISVLAALATTAVNAADADKKSTNEQFKRDIKAAGTGIKDAALEVGHQVATGTKKAYQSDKKKIKKDLKDGKPGDGSIAKQNEAAPTAVKGHK